MCLCLKEIQYINSTRLTILLTPPGSRIWGMMRLQALILLLSTTSLTLSLAAHPTRDAICSMCQKLRCKPTMGEGSGKSKGMKQINIVRAADEPEPGYQEPMPAMGSSSDEDQESHWTEDKDNQDNPPSASSEHNHAGRDKRSGGGDEWKLFPPTNTTGAWLFGK